MNSLNPVWNYFGEAIKNKLRFNTLYLFKYSDRSHTLAYNVFPKVEKNTINSRFKQIERDQFMILFKKLISRLML